MPQIPAISADQVRPDSEHGPGRDPQAASFACSRDSRVAIHSLSMPRPRAEAKMSGRCLASQRSLAGVVIDTQSPPMA
jgi:hypothetical protein